MAKFFYANTWHPELFELDGSKSNAATVEYDGKKWAYIPSNCRAYIYLPNQRLKDFYLSFEYIPIPMSMVKSKEGTSVSGSTTYERTISMRSNIFIDNDVKDGSGNYYWFKLYDITQKCYYKITNISDEIAYNNFIEGNIGSYSYVVSSYTSLETLLKNNEGKFCVHFTSNGSKTSTATTTNVGKASKETDQNGLPMRFGCYGCFIRNIIISEEPISYTDTIKEVTVDSITGSDWYTSGGKSYTEKVNASATVKLNKKSLADAIGAIDARKFAFAGVTNRQGERINALEVKLNSEAHQNILDTGEHTFGSSWSIDSTDMTDTLTITTRKVVGQ